MAATWQWNRGLEANRQGRLNSHPFFTILARTECRTLWQSQLQFSLGRAASLLCLHDQLMRDP